MSSQEIPAQVLQDAPPSRLRLVLTISIIAALAFVAGYALLAMSNDEDEDRPPIFVRNSSVDIREISTGVPGIFTKATTGATWFHSHMNRGPKQLDVWVSGVASTSCVTTGIYFGTKVRDLDVEYRLPDGPTRKVSFAVAKSGVFFPDRYIEITADSSAVTSQPGNTELVLEGAGTVMTQVTMNGPGAKQVVCAFAPNATSEVHIMQRQ